MDDLMLLVSIIAVVAMISFIILGVVKKNKAHFKKVGISLVVAIVAFAGFTMTYDEEESVEAEEPETEEVVEKKESEEEPEVEEEPEEAELEKNEFTSEEKVEEAADDIYGSKLVEVEYIDATNHYNVYAKIAGLSANMDRKSAYFNATNFLEKIKDEDFDSVYIEYQAVFVDDYGNEEERKGITYDITKETVDKINFDSFLAEKLPSVADSYWQHPAFN